jgi:hypothetical protein
MIHLRNLPEALRAGWAEFRSTLFVAPRTVTMVFHQSSQPDERDHGPFINGDLWVNNITLEMFYYLTLEKKWCPLRYNPKTMEKK